MPLFGNSGGSGPSFPLNCNVVWDGTSSWLLGNGGSTITARPGTMRANDSIFFIGNPGGALPAWSTSNDSWNNS